MRDLEEACETIALHPEAADFEGVRTDAIVSAAEEALGIVFPSEYREFLLRLGAGGFKSFEVYGIVNAGLDARGVPNGIWFTLDQRRHGLPANFVVVGESGDGGLYCLNLTAPGAPVVLFWPGSSARTPWEPVSPSFGEFLLSGVRAQLE
jgi:hypothetical protein